MQENENMLMPDEFSAEETEVIETVSAEPVPEEPKPKRTRRKKTEEVSPETEESVSVDSSAESDDRSEDNTFETPIHEDNDSGEDMFLEEIPEEPPIQDSEITVDELLASEDEDDKLCKIQGKYSGKVIDVHKGVCFIRLYNGVNAVAHSCRDRRYPGKKDDVSFTVTSIDEERGTAVGIITRIIKQNL